MTGSLAGAFAAYTGPQKKPVIDRSLLTDIGDVSVIENQACARKVALAAAIWDSCIHQTVQVGEHITDAGNYASSEIAAALGCSKTVADTYSEIGMDLRLRFPAIKTAFEAGELDLQRVRAIYRITSPYSTPAVERTETEILTAALHLSPGPLATEIDAIMHRSAPEEATELRKDLTRLTGVRYRDKDMIATIEAHLEAADAAASWQLINEMADTICPRDPRTRGQRRAAAYTALMRRENHIPCTCEPDDDHPCTANPELPDRRTPLTNITIDINTLLGLADLPAYLAGHGHIDADYARQLAENSDLQILLTEVLDLARNLGLATDNEGQDADAEDKNDGTSDDANTDDKGQDADADAEDDREPTDDVDLGPARKTYPTTHLTFHPLGRGRRRRGMALPKPQPSHTRTRTDATSGPHEGRYTLIAALETAIAANPGLAHALYPDGHGGHIEPPDGALRYRPTTALADCVRQRDRTCRHPGCDVPAAACEIDHVIPYNHRNPARGGWTTLTNLHCLCKYHHALKTMGAWTPTMLAGAVNYWESSSGTTAITLPGSAIGTTDCAEQPLIPHIPRKRRPTCTDVSTETDTVPEDKADSGSQPGTTAWPDTGTHRYSVDVADSDLTTVSASKAGSCVEKTTEAQVAAASSPAASEAESAASESASDTVDDDDPAPY